MRPGALKLCLSFVAGAAVSAAVAVAQAPKTTWDGVYTAEQAKRGAGLYQTHCAMCHGDALQGIEAAPALVGETFASTWEGVPLEDLFERMRSTMPQTAPGSLGRQVNADILAFMLQSAKFPAGAAPLDPTTTPLAEIQYRTYRP